MKRYIYMVMLLALRTHAVKSQALYNNGASIEFKNGTLIYVNGNFNNQSGTLKNDGSLAVKGNIVNNQIFNTYSAGTMTMDGSAAQTISGSSPLFVKNLVINNTNGVTLSNSVSVDGVITFSNGILHASSAPLILTASATHSGVSHASHVNGYVQRRGTGTFAFPVGDGVRYQPANINLTSNSNGINVRYFGADAGTATFSTTGSSSIPLNAYNNQEYWDISPVGTASGAVTLLWDDYKNPSITASSNTSIFKIAHKTLSGWQNEGSSAVTGTSSAGSVTSALLSSWSPFTLGVIDESVLPVTLVSFTARQVESEALIEWQTTREQNASHFDIERSSDARNFTKIGVREASGNSSASLNYAFSDRQFGAMVQPVYYRLRSVDRDGTFSLSRTVSLTNGASGLSLNLYPNPALRNTLLTLEGNIPAGKISLLNSLGVSMPVTMTNPVNGKAQVDTSMLPPGSYTLHVTTHAGAINKKFVIH